MQVLKEPLGTKGARITSHISLPGRFLVYMPTVNHIGVSRKIESRDERRRVRGIVQKFKEETGLPGGVIIRTAAVNRPGRRHPQRSPVFPDRLDRSAATQGDTAGAGGALSRREPRRKVVARFPDGTVHRDQD